MSDFKDRVVKLKGKLMWPKLHQPDTKYTPRWTVDLLLDAEGLAEAKTQGLRIKKNNKAGEARYADTYEGYDGSFLRIEKPCKTADGKELDPPAVKNKKLQDITSDTIIGNGTDAYVRFSKKTKNMEGKEMSPAEAMKAYGGYGMFLLGVQVLDLVEYKGAADPDKDFVVEASEGDFDWDNGDENPFDEIQEAS